MAKSSEYMRKYRQKKKAHKSGNGGISGRVDFEEIISASPVSINFSVKSNPTVIDRRNPNGSLVYGIKGKSLQKIKENFPKTDDFVMEVREGRQKDNAMKLFSQLGYEPQAWYFSDTSYQPNRYYMVKKKKK